MNTTDYFININAMFLFCIFTCGLLVWAVLWGLNTKNRLNNDLRTVYEKLNLETIDNTERIRKYDTLFKQHIERGKRIIALEVAKDNAEKESRELRKQLTESENQANGYKAEFIAVSNELEATKAKVRKRDKDGKFLPSGNARPKRVKKVKAAIEVESPKLVHGLTVKNPTKDEAKMIFDEAKRLGLRIHAEERSAADLPHIWFTPNDTVSRCIIGALQRQYVTAKEFVQRMQNGRG